MYRWKTKYNEWKASHDWDQYKDRDSIEQAIVDKLEELLNEQEDIISSNGLCSDDHCNKYHGDEACLKCPKIH